MLSGAANSSMRLLGSPPMVDVRHRCTDRTRSKQPGFKTSKPCVATVTRQKKWYVKDGYEQPCVIVIIIRYERFIDLYIQIKLKNPIRMVAVGLGGTEHLHPNQIPSILVGVLNFVLRGTSSAKLILVFWIRSVRSMSI